MSTPMANGSEYEYVVGVCQFTTGWPVGVLLLAPCTPTFGGSVVPVTTVCAVALSLAQYDAVRVHGYGLARREVVRVLGELGSVGLEERKKIPGVEAGRADVIFAGTVILERIMAHFNLDRIIVSDQGVRWGLVWRELEAGAGR